MRKYKLKSTFGTFPIIIFKGIKLYSAYNKEKCLLKKKKKPYLYHKLTIYKSEKNIIWHIIIRSSKKTENGHSFIGYSNSYRETALDLKHFDISLGIKFPDIKDKDYLIKKENKLQFLQNDFNRTRTECLENIEELKIYLD